MRWHIIVVSLVVLASGCTDVDENTKWDPQAQLPSWTYDAPFYYRPTEELEPAETVGDGINVYYTRNEWFYILHPANTQPAGEPRVGVWYSTDRGNAWKQAGFFGVEQSHFVFRAPEDGDYWIRLAGPGQGVTQIPPGMPHRIYVVDRKAPTISLSLSGEAAGRAKDRKAPPLAAGEPVTLAWGVSDAHLVPDSIELIATGADFPDNVPLVRLNQTLGDGGSLTVTIPAQAARTGGVRFQMRAVDKAGNVGLAATEALSTAKEAPATQPAAMTASEWLAVPTGMVPTGWPMAGAFLRGGKVQTLRWIPEQAKEYRQVDLQFSANDGRDLTWTTVASGLKIGRDVQWTTPPANSKSCRLRVIGILPDGQTDNGEPYVVLAFSPRFTVDTAGLSTTPTTQP